MNQLGGVYFLHSDDDENKKMNMVISSMVREVVDIDHFLITEGESGQKLYIVESGELIVTIAGNFIRKMTTGCMLGELALLYDAPRTATIQCVTECVLWSLKRKVFKMIQSASADGKENNSVEKAKRFICANELAILSPIDLSRLMNTLKTRNYFRGDFLYKEDNLTSQCIHIENGTARVYSKTNPGVISAEELDNLLGITRPIDRKRSGSVISPKNNT